MMIEINLLPPELRVKEKKTTAGINRSVLAPAAGAAVLIVVIANLCLWGTSAYRQGQLKKMTREWEELEPQRRVLAEAKVKYSALMDASSARKQITSRRIIWAEKLSALSRYVPSGMWFRELSITARDFALNGSVVVVLKDEMGVIKGFVDDLKGDPGFSGDFSSLELGTVKKKDIGQVSVAEFTLSGVLKQ